MVNKLQEKQEREKVLYKKPQKRRNYKKELEQATAENKDLKEKFLRIAAEFDNYRKRVDREMIVLRESAKAELVSQLLPVLDDLERSIDAGSKNHDANSLLEGIKLVQKSFLRTLQNEGLKPMNSVGEPFDPEKHEALLQIEAKDKDPEIVVEEHLKGYEFKDRVIRHAKVIVSK